METTTSTRDKESFAAFSVMSFTLSLLFLNLAVGSAIGGHHLLARSIVIALSAVFGLTGFSFIGYAVEETD